MVRLLHMRLGVFHFLLSLLGESQSLSCDVLCQVSLWSDTNSHIYNHASAGVGKVSLHTAPNEAAWHAFRNDFIEADTA